MMDHFQQRLEKAKVEQDLFYFTAGEGKKARVWFNSGKNTRLVGSFHKRPELKKFWYSQDCTPENLVNQVSKSTFVAIDIGNHQSETAVDVGIAILPTSPNLYIPLEQGVASLVKYGAYIHNFCTPTQGSLPVRDFEPLRFGSEETLQADKIEEKLVKILQKTKREADKLGNKLALILFDAGGDVKAISRLFPKIIPLFDWWTDIQAIASKITITVGGTDENTPKSSSYSLGEILVALGHKALCHGGTSQRLSKHKSSHDAARTLVVVVGIARKIRAGEKLTVQEHIKAGPTMMTRKIWTRRPQPAELFPFIANIKMETGCPTPREFRRCKDLWGIFAEYEPNAVGRRICHSISTWADWSNECKGRCGACIWISVPTKELVEQLVKDFHGKQMQDGRLVVKDTSIHLEEGKQDEGNEDEESKTKENKANEQSGLSPQGSTGCEGEKNPD